MMAMEEELEEMGVPAEAGDEPSADRCTDAAGAGVRRVIDTRRRRYGGCTTSADRCIPTTAGGDGRGRMNISYAVDS